jgi:hypothetical protein
MTTHTVTQGMRAYGKTYKIGDVVELDDNKARVLIAMGRVEAGGKSVVEKPAKKKKNRSIGLPDTDSHYVSTPTDELEIR